MESVVIDKDLVEWGALKAAFPRAKILLCQFHAIARWKKVRKRAVSNENVPTREGAETDEQTTLQLCTPLVNIYIQQSNS
ncbi:hypothetical protein F444_06843 [Phytophthora nicotianae P1976]|uniref:MULE transposase domain-containing protein n=1 Tax=Phytophthora nicotianae P1976 TaxID=1317066 RepID=A0A081AGP8_PHYNI|nr:hypothetical protein F444_06843 [Phytophthora nicotianae P1976]